MSTPRRAALCLLSCLLAACGQAGPLYLPEPPAAPEQTLPPAAGEARPTDTEAPKAAQTPPDERPPTAP